MANNIIRRVWNQNRMVNIEDLTGAAFQAESGGHTFEISGIDDTGAAVELSGTVAGVFRRPDNADIALTGSASDGVVSVTLTEDCYAVPGRFGLTIFVTSNSQKVAVYACVGTVAVSSTGNVAGDTPASVEDLIDDINAAIADLNSAIGQIPASYANVMAAIAPTYSGSALYSVGSYAWHNGSLYRCTTPITTAEAWTAAHWTAAVLGDDIGDLKSALNDIQSGVITGVENIHLGTLIADRYITTAGNVQNYNGWSATDYVAIPDNVKTIIVNATDSSQGNYNAFYNSSKTFISNFSYEAGCTKVTVAEGAKYMRLSGTTSIMSTLTVSFALLVNGKLDGGYYCLNRYVKANRWGYVSIGDIGSTVDFTPVPNSSTVFGVFDVSKGDMFRISGSGGNASRLWAFTDTSGKILSKSAANLAATNLIITAPANGKLVYNSYFNNYDIWKSDKNATDTYNESLAQAAYDRMTDGLDILSAFSNVTCCGDSLTASVVYTRDNGDGTHQTRSAYKKYPAILGQKIGAEAESVATGGYSASDWWAAYDDRLVQKTNQLIIVYLGTNGGLTDTISTDASGDDYTQYANTNTGNYCKIVAKALSVGAKVLLIKIHQGGGGNVYTTNDVIDKVAEKFNVAVVDVPFLNDRQYHAFPDNSGVNSLHYNDLGYAAFADSLIKCVGYLPTTMQVRLIPD